MVQQRALDVLKGHLPFTASFMKGDQEWYRARFAGFSQDDAEGACAALKKLSLDCAIMLAEYRRLSHARPNSTSFASLIRAAR